MLRLLAIRRAIGYILMTREARTRPALQRIPEAPKMSHETKPDRIDEVASDLDDVKVAVDELEIIHRTVSGLPPSIRSNALSMAPSMPSTTWRTRSPEPLGDRRARTVPELGVDSRSAPYAAQFVL